MPKDFEQTCPTKDSKSIYEQFTDHPKREGQKVIYKFQHTFIYTQSLVSHYIIHDCTKKYNTHEYPKP